MNFQFFKVINSFKLIMLLDISKIFVFKISKFLNIREHLKSFNIFEFLNF